MELITSTDALAGFCARATQFDFVTVDTEFLRETTYWPKLCLLQAATPEEAILVDPLADGLSLQPFFELLANRKFVKVFHAARQDIEIFVKLSGVVPQIAVHRVAGFPAVCLLVSLGVLGTEPNRIDAFHVGGEGVNPRLASIVIVSDLGKLPAMDIRVLMDRQPDLPLIIRALRTSRGAASGLHRRQQQRDQHADDGDDDQQFNERKPVSRSCAHDGPLTGKPNGETAWRELLLASAQRRSLRETIMEAE